MKYIILILILFGFNIHSKDDDHKHEHEHEHTHDENKNNNKVLKPHLHGTSLVNIVQEKDILVFSFKMPGFDVVGFEYEAKKKEDVKKVKNALRILSKHQNMIVPSIAAACKLENSKVELLNDKSHSEFISEYRFKCENISKIENIRFNFFRSFKKSENLEINIVTENKKGSISTDQSKIDVIVKNFF